MLEESLARLYESGRRTRTAGPIATDAAAAINLRITCDFFG